MIVVDVGIIVFMFVLVHCHRLCWFGPSQSLSSFVIGSVDMAVDMLASGLNAVDMAVENRKGSFFFSINHFLL